MRFLLLLFITAAGVSASAQQWNPQQADSLRQLLTKRSNPSIRIKTLIHLAEYYIWKKGEIETDLDSANTCLSEAERLNQNVRSTELAGHQLLIKGFMLTERGKRVEGQKAVEQSIPLLQKNSSQRLLGMAYFELQAYYDYSDTAQCRRRISITGLAVEAFHQAGDKEMEGYALTTLGDLHSIMEEYATSNKCLGQALIVYNAIGHKQLQDVYELLGRNCNDLGDFKHALEYALLALKTANATKDSSMQLATINNLLGSLYRNASRPELSIRYYKEGLAVALRHRDPPNVLIMAYVLGRAYLDIDQPREAIRILDSLPRGLVDPSNAKVKALLGMVYMKGYYAENQLAKAYKYSVILEKLVEVHALTAEWTNLVCVELSKYNLSEHAVVKARLYLSKALVVPLPRTSPAWIPRYNIIYKIDSAEGDYKTAFYDLLTYKTFADSLFDEVKTRQFQQLDVEYETSKKVDSISLLTQRSELQTANLRQTQLIRNITIAGIVLTLAIIGLLYRQYQLKQQNNKIMTIKNEHLEHLVMEKEWLLQEVHHRVKNNLQTIESLLDLQSDSLGEDARFALQTSQNRIYATSLLHQKLYMSGNLSSVNMEVYLTELIQHLRDVFNVNTRITVRMNIDPVELDFSQGVPIGLMVNEIITNSFKHAFDQSILHPEVVVSLAVEQGTACLVISDNGIGFADSDEEQCGLGLKLAKGLAKQIGGEATIVSDKGTNVQILFTLQAITIARFP